MSRYSILLAAVTASLAVAPTMHAQDVMKVAPNHYKVLVENAYVRVVENTLAPGEADPMHTHPRGWYTVTKAGKMKVAFASGKVEMWDAKLGESAWTDGEPPHTSENVGTTPIVYVLVEIKGGPASNGQPKRQ